eukprot:3721820-Prymnesium_polylepis.1
MGNASRKPRAMKPRTTSDTDSHAQTHPRRTVQQQLDQQPLEHGTARALADHVRLVDDDADELRQPPLRRARRPSERCRAGRRDGEGRGATARR